MTLQELSKYVLSVDIVHNQHKTLYESVDDYLKELEEDLVFAEGALSDEIRQRMMETDTVWTIQWYPRTAVSFCLAVAPTCEEVLEIAATFVARGTPNEG